MQTLENGMCDKVKSEVKDAVATVETRVHEAILSAMDNLVAGRMELAMRSVGVSSVPSPSSDVLDPDQKEFSGDTIDLQMTTSSGCNSRANLIRIDETHGNFTVEDANLPVVKEISTGKHTLIANTHRVCSVYMKDQNCSRCSETVLLDLPEGTQ